MLSLGAVVTGGTLERSAPVMVRRGDSEAAGLQMRHDSSHWLNRRNSKATLAALGYNIRTRPAYLDRHYVIR
jgi:hypothetical protein